MIRIRDLAKGFVLHNQGGTLLPVLAGIALDARPGDCVALDGPSGAGKSTLLRLIYGNYRAYRGRILVRQGEGETDVASADPRAILVLRRTTLGYVSQFLREIPRVAARDVVAEPLRARGMMPDAARRRAAGMLGRLNLPERLWDLPPATFSGGERQRVNLARAFAADYPIMLLDEPTSALDPMNRDAVLALIGERLRAGTTIIGIMHDPEARARVATRTHEMQIAAGQP